MGDFLRGRGQVDKLSGVTRVTEPVLPKYEKHRPSMYLSAQPCQDYDSVNCALRTTPSDPFTFITKDVLLASSIVIIPLDAGVSVAGKVQDSDPLALASTNVVVAFRNNIVEPVPLFVTTTTLPDPVPFLFTSRVLPVFADVAIVIP